MGLQGQLDGFLTAFPLVFSGSGSWAPKNLTEEEVGWGCVSGQHQDGWLVGAGTLSRRHTSKRT